MTFEDAMRWVEEARAFPAPEHLHARRLAWILRCAGLTDRAARTHWALVAGSCGKASTARFLAFIARRLLDRASVDAPSAGTSRTTWRKRGTSATPAARSRVRRAASSAPSAPTSSPPSNTITAPMCIMRAPPSMSKKTRSVAESLSRSIVVRLTRAGRAGRCSRAPRARGRRRGRCGGGARPRPPAGRA